MSERASEARPPERSTPSPEASGEILDAIRTLRDRARMRPGLAEEAVERMQALGYEVARVGDADALVSRVLQIIPPGADVVYHPSAVGRTVHLDDTLRREGRHIVVLPDDSDPYRQDGSWREHILAAQFGVTGANAVVADTGSLALAEDSGFGRAASNVPPVHIALVTADSIVENLLDAAEVARAYAALHLGRPLPRYVSFITGPSRTADIGLQLVRGMHGPRVVHVLVWDHPKATGLDEAALRAWLLA